MKSAKRYTNATFTKRVDREGGARRGSMAMKEPASCRECGAIYINRRWTMREPDLSDSARRGYRPVRSILCPACQQVSSGIFGGYLTVDGSFYREHKAEIGRLIANEAGRALDDDPLSRIMDEAESDGRLSIKTTTEHLAQRLGKALEKAYDGETDYDFSHENKLARVHWHRDR